MAATANLAALDESHRHQLTPDGGYPYIRLRSKFVFLSVVIDRYSRNAIGWALGRSLSAR